ncbi:hypothetical protein EUX98_g8781 [Antrodiella citrinella]|uniref:Uncharacterized protein n=1 Tax=Antrodiella citrinella TaxID=2447956 RepID=A0A4S4M2Y2_9APHY|nr:hypothetical protein EUX98_g8781 [Antrodiella citrinella]
MALNASTMPEFFGGFFLLAMLAILLYGILSFQTFAYSVRGTELQFAKAVIVSVWMLETIHSALVIHITYNYTIDDFDHAGNMRDIIWVTGMLITLFIQSFYLHRVYLLGERSLVVPLVVGVALLGRFASVIARHRISIRLIASKRGWHIATRRSPQYAALDS